MRERVSKFFASFEYFDIALIVVSVINDSISIASFATVNGTRVGRASASFSFAFPTFMGIVKKLLKTTQNKKKKHNKIVMLARNKLSSIESKISEALINNEMSHEDSITNINEDRNCQELKETIRTIIIKRSDTERSKFY